MVSAYLVYSGMSAEEALQVYAHKRTTNNEGVSIPSQRRYVGYWENTVSIPRGVDHGPPSVNSPELCSRELVRIRLYDTVNTGSVFFVVSELQEVPYITTALMDAKLGTKDRKDLFDWLSRQLSGLSNFPDAVNLNYVLFQIVMRDRCDL
ncbi:phosphatidylinositol 3,4,5-trisphosphate 3-phosphatase and protein-tyrosine-phosphatase PTEN1-like [Camellia sinensis]|uniref:phosphatidylinositol 3,4,5-trisphosphate 3-phosphatase and protein-tyrosine-phosphatase PTEN1-like n=1 Tax=Camellia sinensis TaxID=4442 RepID=UPI001035B4FC|nr:phosphatidylinositol 3,4,5-trisphosphate 3-phosphatase and protein-tyrosine-phosphatase PTEN1-like [Camellia sinensis]